MTITATPPAYSSLQGDLIYTVSDAHASDPVTYPNYKFVGDVYINGVMFHRIKKVPDPVTGIGIFNIGQLVRNYLTVTFNPTANNIVAQRLGAGEFSLQVTMKFGEEYSYITYTNILSDSARLFYNNYNDRIDYTSLTGLADKVLSDRPNQTPVKSNSTFNFIPFLPSDTDVVTVRVKTYDYSNSLVTSYNYSLTPAAANELVIINASKNAINAGSSGAINDSIKYYTVEFDTPNIAPDSIYRFDMTCEAIYDVYTIHFLNKYGGFESKDFTKVSRKTISIEKKDFGRLPYTVDGSGIVSYKSANNVYNESRSVYSSQYKEKMTLNSDLLTDAEFTWLQQLVLSPMVYLESNGVFIPCVITENNYEPKLTVNDELNNLVINIEFGEQLNAQFR